MNIALKEVNETLYWLSLLKDTIYIEGIEFFILRHSSIMIVKIPASFVKAAMAILGK